MQPFLREQTKSNCFCLAPVASPMNMDPELAQVQTRAQSSVPVRTPQAPTLTIMPATTQLFQKSGFPRPFLPTQANISLSRKRWTAGTRRFTSSTTALTALPPTPSWKEEDVKIPVRAGIEIPGRVYIPFSKVDSLPMPLMVMFHGGGFCLGGLDTEEFLCRLLCHRLSVVVLNVAYRLAPEFPFPCGAEDALDAVKWVGASRQVAPFPRRVRIG